MKVLVGSCIIEVDGQGMRVIEKSCTARPGGWRRRITMAITVVDSITDRGRV